MKQNQLSSLSRCSLLSAFILTSASFPLLSAPVSSTIEGSGPISTPVIHKGDTVNIEAILNTNDVNENGEGEPLTVQSSSGFSFSISAYGQKRSASYEATADNETLSGFISGNDADEWADITVDVNQKKRFTDAQKAALAQAAARLNTDAGYIATAAAICLAIPDPSATKICGFLLTLGSGAAWVLSGELNELALDPVDPNYTQIAIPSTPTFTSLAADSNVTQAEVDSLNALISNQTQAIGLARAIITSINRAQGAFEANDTLWENNQMNAARQYAIQLSGLLNNEASLQANVKNALVSAGFPSITVTPNDVLNFEYSVLINGLPTSLVQTLTQLGSSSAEIDQIRQLAYVQNIYDVAGTFPDNYINSALNTDIGNAASALNDFALANAAPLSSGQHVSGNGFIVGQTGSEIDINFNAVGKTDKAGNPTLVGTNFHLLDHASGLNITKGQVTKAAILGSQAIVNGTYQASDNSTGTFSVIAINNSKQGAGYDSISVNLSSGYQASGTLGGGQVIIQK